MRRLTWLVPRARVLLSDVNGPRGGVEQKMPTGDQDAERRDPGHHLGRARLALRPWTPASHVPHKP